MNESKIIESYNEGVSKIVALIKELNMGLTSQVSSLNQEIQALRGENLRLLAKIAELEAKSKKNSQVTIVNVTNKLYRELEEFEHVLKEQLKKAVILHTGESGMRSKGKTNWVHTASTEYLKS